LVIDDQAFQSEMLTVTTVIKPQSFVRRAVFRHGLEAFAGLAELHYDGGSTVLELESVNHALSFILAAYLYAPYPESPQGSISFLITSFCVPEALDTDAPSACVSVYSDCFTSPSESAPKLEEYHRAGEGQAVNILQPPFVCSDLHLPDLDDYERLYPTKKSPPVTDGFLRQVAEAMRAVDANEPAVPRVEHRFLAKSREIRRRFNEDERGAMTEFAKLVVLLIVDGWGSGSPADEIGSMGFGQIDGGIPDWLLTDGRAWAVVDWVLRNEGWASQHYGEGALMQDRRL
jgi:hypothetical protein